MSDTVTTFAEHLNHFVLSVDIVSDDTFDAVRDLVVNYMRNELEAAYFGLMERTQIVSSPGLQTIWNTGGPKNTIPIRENGAGPYTRQVALAFDTGRPLWVVDKERRPLREGGDHVDLWSGEPDLPPYHPPINRPMKTSIMVPLTRDGSALGVMYLESTAYVEATEVARDELTLLADSLGMLMELRNLNRSLTECTKKAVGQLTSFMGDGKVQRLTKPSLFVASSGKADGEVMDIIREVLDDYRSKVNVIDWTKIEESGAITTQIATNIARSRFGVCYFSERADQNGTFAYVDNPNVIFEAGMLHALINAPDAPPSGWIPVRESASPPAPFDFASQRIEPVPRAATGHVDREQFRMRLRNRVAALLRDPVDEQTDR
jgi:hypothetical protein